jgi:two-component system sensor histidine kinase/response regulator
MSSSGIADGLSNALATARATPGQRRVALAIAVASLLIFVAIAPFVRTSLPRMPAFIPAYQVALFFIDLITAVLLIDQFLRLRSTGLLFLAAGYLFDALIIVPHTLTFPGAFSPTGFLRAGPQTTAWLYVFWHGGFPLFVIAYAMLRKEDGAQPRWTTSQARLLVVAAVAGVAALVAALTLLATWGHDLLPVVMQGSNYSQLVSKGVSPAVWLITLLAIVMLWRRDIRVMDLWLMLVMWIWLFDIALAAILGSSRFDLGFYAGRVFGLIAAGFLLIALIVELARMYGRTPGSAASLEEKTEAAPDTPLPPRAQDREVPVMGTASFIHGKNLVHYRALLQSGRLSDAERHTVQRLLSEEERRVPG